MILYHEDNVLSADVIRLMSRIRDRVRKIRTLNDNKGWEDLCVRLPVPDVEKALMAKSRIKRSPLGDEWGDFEEDHDA